SIEVDEWVVGFTQHEIDDLADEDGVIPALVLRPLAAFDPGDTAVDSWDARRPEEVRNPCERRVGQRRLAGELLGKEGVLPCKDVDDPSGRREQPVVGLNLLQDRGECEWRVEGQRAERGYRDAVVAVLAARGDYRDSRRNPRHHVLEQFLV